MFKPTILIGTLLVSNLAGLCCAAPMPEMGHHHMTSPAQEESRSMSQIRSWAGHCNSQVENTSSIERDLDRGCVMGERMKQGGSDVPVDYTSSLIDTTAYPVSAPGFFRHRCRYHGSTPPQILEQSSDNQLLF
jgi:hypothetical protein